VKAGGDFAELAKKYSDDKGDAQNPGSAEKGGEVGWILKDQTVAEFEKVAFSQAKGQISDLVQSSFGFHIIQTEEKEDAHLKPLAEVKTNIEPIIKAQKASDLREKTSTEAANLAQKEGLDKAAAKYKAQVVSSNPVSLEDTLPGVGPSPTLMDAVFTTAEKSVPQTGRAAQAYVFFEVTKIEPARTPSLDEIKVKVANDFKSMRANDLLRRNHGIVASFSRALKSTTPQRCTRPSTAPAIRSALREKAFAKSLRSVPPSTQKKNCARKWEPPTFARKSALQPQSSRIRPRT
jgi:peptidyl-prolyl cis-trans isomerase D